MSARSDTTRPSPTGRADRRSPGPDHLARMSPTMRGRRKWYNDGNAESEGATRRSPVHVNSASRNSKAATKLQIKERQPSNDDLPEDARRKMRSPSPRTRESGLSATSGNSRTSSSTQLRASPRSSHTHQQTWSPRTCHEHLRSQTDVPSAVRSRESVGVDVVGSTLRRSSTSPMAALNVETNSGAQEPVRSSAKSSNHAGTSAQAAHRKTPLSKGSAPLSSSAGSNAIGVGAVERSPKLCRKGSVPLSKYQKMIEACDRNIEQQAGTSSRMSDPAHLLRAVDVRAGADAGRPSLGAKTSNSSRKTPAEHFLKTLADINASSQRQSPCTNSADAEIVVKPITVSTKTPQPEVINISGKNTFTTPVATANNMVGYISGNDVIVISNDVGATGFTGASPLESSQYVAPPAPRKQQTSVNRSEADVGGFEGALQRLEAEGQEALQMGNTRYNFEVTSPDVNVVPVAAMHTKQLQLQQQRTTAATGSREGSLEMWIASGARPKTRDSDVIVGDSGIGNHLLSDQTRTNSRGSHYSLDLHSDADLVDDGISLSADARLRKQQQQVGAANARVMQKRHLPMAADDGATMAPIPPMKLDFEGSDDELEESYCRIVESERRSQLSRQKQHELAVHRNSAFSKPASHSGSANNPRLVPAADEDSLQSANTHDQKFSPIERQPVTSYALVTSQGGSSERSARLAKSRSPVQVNVSSVNTQHPHTLHIHVTPSNQACALVTSHAQASPQAGAGVGHARVGEAQLQQISRDHAATEAVQSSHFVQTMSQSRATAEKAGQLQ